MPGLATGLSEGQDVPISCLENEIARLANAVLHLTRSNTELQDALKHDPDPEYEAAIKENCEVMAGMVVEVEKLTAALQEARKGTHASTTLPESMLIDSPKEEAVGGVSQDDQTVGVQEETSLSAPSGGPDFGLTDDSSLSETLPVDRPQQGEGAWM
eukprot:TRINITY_DN14847_c0_g1_i1.p1 TRINITY_DN14847_c0_g1~~TRINITY_DN14847_c0_g1_i1.p1  ORF type:complete len:157 (+),score=37.09 TRINITY_DN14847_c0_g1_i1:105-575(+)